MFRDEEELPAAADLSAEIREALENSEYLIVVCSPRTPGSVWVGRDIELFRELGKGDRILSCLIEGEPAASFPPALSPAGIGANEAAAEPLAADFRPANGLGRRATWRIARLKLMAGLLGCDFDELVVREQIRRVRMLIASGIAALAVVATIAAFAVFAWIQRNEAQAQRAEAIHQRDAALLTQSRFLTDLTNKEDDKGNASLGILLALEALPKNWSDRERPYYPPAMAGLYRAATAERELLTIGPGGKIGTTLVSDAELSPDGSRLLVGGSDGSVELWNPAVQRRLGTWAVAAKPVRHIAFGRDRRYALAAAGPSIYRVDLVSGKVDRVITLGFEDFASNDFSTPENINIDEMWPNSDGGRIVVLSDGVVQLWTSGPNGYIEHQAMRLVSGMLFYHYAVSPDSRFIATGDGISGEVTVVDLETTSRRQIKLADYGQPQGSYSATFDGSGDRLLIGGSKAAILIDLKTMERKATLTDHLGSVLRRTGR
nr:MULTISPECIES: TIR domain-containing protein [Mesorhizobium]